MFDLFSDRSKKAFGTARTLAKVDRLRFIGVTHILMGLLSEEDSVAAQIIEGFNIKPAKLREILNSIPEIVEKFSPGEPNEPSYSEDAKKVVEQSNKEAQGRSDLIGTEHVLLAILHGSYTAVTNAFGGLGVKSDDLYKNTVAFVDSLTEQAAEGAAAPLPNGEQLAVIAVLQPGLPATSIDRVMEAIAMLRGISSVDIMRVRVKPKEEEKSPILTGKMAAPDRRILR